VSDIDRARARASDADAAIARGEVWGPLHGVPTTVKESFDIIGCQQPGGCRRSRLIIPRPMRSRSIVFLTPASSSLPKPTCQRCWQIGRPSIRYMERQTTRGIWPIRRVSSGGSSAALAAGLTGLDAGSDIGGSIRNPGALLRHLWSQTFVRNCPDGRTGISR
jgi:amidase